MNGKQLRMSKKYIFKFTSQWIGFVKFRLPISPLLNFISFFFFFFEIVEKVASKPLLRNQTWFFPLHEIENIAMWGSTHAHDGSEEAKWNVTFSVVDMWHKNVHKPWAGDSLLLVVCMRQWAFCIMYHTKSMMNTLKNLSFFWGGSFSRLLMRMHAYVGV